MHTTCFILLSTIINESTTPTCIYISSSHGRYLDSFIIVDSSMKQVVCIIHEEKTKLHSTSYWLLFINLFTKSSSFISSCLPVSRSFKITEFFSASSGPITTSHLIPFLSAYLSCLSSLIPSSG